MKKIEGRVKDLEGENKKLWSILASMVGNNPPLFYRERRICKEKKCDECYHKIKFTNGSEILACDSCVKKNSLGTGCDSQIYQNGYSLF